MNAHVDYKQAGRVLSIATPLGEDILLLERLDGREGLSSLFEFQAAVLSKLDPLKPAAIIGSTVDLTLDRGADLPPRTWNGLVTELQEGPQLSSGLRSYVLTVRPTLWLATQRQDCRIWQDKTSLQVADAILSEHGIPAADTAGVTSTPLPRPYSVQWNESNFDYLARRLAEDGLFYWFEHRAGVHQLTIADHPSGYCDSGLRIVISLTQPYADGITRWDRRFLLTPGKQTVRDWNFETPLSPPQGDAPSLVRLSESASSCELYEYPGGFLTPTEAEASARLRIQAVEAAYEVVSADSLARSLAPGHRFKPYELGQSDSSYDMHVVTDIVHAAVSATYQTGGTTPRYSNRLSAIPARVPATPRRSTARPRIAGLQIAVVAGPPGEEIHTDPYGRIKLRFPWDRRARGDGSDTCWVRVAQGWAGVNWGAQLIPRVGMEVLVAFLEGDPDRPLVVGAVPNPINRVPYPLPDNKTRMTIKSKTYRGAGSNELSFEDDSGREQVYVHAQRDMTTEVLNDYSLDVKQDAHVHIGANRTVKVDQSSSETIERDLSIAAGNSLVLTVGQARLEMTSDGRVTITGSEFDFSASGTFGIHGNPVDSD
jgi:type VI secretion system secreted protein VgrG